MVLLGPFYQIKEFPIYCSFVKFTSIYLFYQNNGLMVNFREKCFYVASPNIYTTKLPFTISG